MRFINSNYLSQVKHGFGGRLIVAISFAAGSLLLALVVSRGWDAYWKSRDDANLARLNEAVLDYAQTSGKKPDVNLIDLYKSGMTNRRLHPTPFGGYYRYDTRAGVVYNPYRLECRPSVQITSHHP